MNAYGFIDATTQFAARYGFLPIRIWLDRAVVDRMRAQLAYGGDERFWFCGIEIGARSDRKTDR